VAFCGRGKALHLLFPERLTGLTKVKQRLDPISHKFIQKLGPLFETMSLLSISEGMIAAKYQFELHI